MKYLVLVLISAVGLLCIKLTQSRHEFNHLQRIQTATVQACKEWYPVEKELLLKN